ncbi:sialoadhesin-like isoform X2 [Sparus aurata]|uniref:Sialoadhesin-like n=1 Tax=Sparus aurata TaxID=8175 RepID=A0A671UG45_SPAAU|nr:sialoadhesin-like isoform X2 [Sparus aurata]
MKSTLLLVSHVTVSPDMSQFTEYRKITVSCEHSSGEWTVWRYTTGSEQVLSQCGDDWGQQKPSACLILVTKRSDSGVYWCESKYKDSSNTINITVGGAVILQSPFLPVTEGENVTLTCTTRAPSSNLSADFYKNGSLIRTEPTGHMTIHHVSRPDEGLYKCNIRGHGESPPSWLVMKDDPPPASLSVSPDSSQLHGYENIILTCGDNSHFQSWRVMRAVITTTLRGKLSLQTCGTDWGSPTNDGCTLQTVKKADSGVYWCESPARQRSNSVHLTVVDEGLILRIPVLPVRTGENVTLTCRNKTSNLSADFYKDGSFIRTEPTGHMTIHHVSRSDEGLYKCNISSHGESPSSWLFVLDPQDAASSTGPPVLKGIYYFLMIAPYCISTFFM